MKASKLTYWQLVFGVFFYILWVSSVFLLFAIGLQSNNIFVTAITMLLGMFDLAMLIAYCMHKD